MALSGVRDMSVIETPPKTACRCRLMCLNTIGASWLMQSAGKCSAAGRFIICTTGWTPLTAPRRGSGRCWGRSAGGDCARKTQRATALGGDAGVSDGQTQVLVCTTIIETGIDIPNVNTLIIEDADHLGLAQLHQIRGRIGRGARRAFAYLTAGERFVGNGG